MVHRGALLGHHRAAADDCRLVRHLPGWLPQELPRREGPWRNRCGASGHHLLVAVGGHAGDGPKIGDVDFGPGSHFDYEAATLAWYDYLFKDAKNEFAGKPVKIFVMGANQWREEDDWPLARAQATKYFCARPTRRTRCVGMARCQRPRLARPKQRISTFTIPRTPRRPLADRSAVTPSTCRRVRAITSGRSAQRMCCVFDRPARVGYRSHRPGKPGAVRQVISGDTDFTAKLVDVWPDGFAQNLTDAFCARDIATRRKNLS